jgi:hypothetical protein
MAPSPLYSARKRSHSRSLFIALLCVVGTACGTTAPTGKVLFDDPRGTVSLQKISDPSIQATHPINLEPALLAQLLRGIGIQYQEHGLQKMIVGQSPPVPVFSEDQIQFLAPLLAQGLRTAASDQSVEYRVQATRKGIALESPITETTAGSLYAYGRSLYVTLSQYRYAASRTDTRKTSRGQVPDTTGLLNRILTFTPSTAQRPESFNQPTDGMSTDRFLVIDYQLLQPGAPVVAATIAQTAPQVESVTESASRDTETLAQRDAEIRTLKDLVVKKELELDSLRKELESVRKQLDSQKRKITPPSKPTPTIP